MQDWIDWAQTEAGQWFAKAIAAVAGSVMLVWKGLPKLWVVIVKVWREFHDRFVTTAIQRGDAELLQRIVQQEQHAERLAADFQHRLNDWQHSHDDLKAYVEQVRLTVKSDVEDIRDDIGEVKATTDRHSITLGILGANIKNIDENVGWLRELFEKQRDRRDA